MEVIHKNRGERLRVLVPLGERYEDGMDFGVAFSTKGGETRDEDCFWCGCADGVWTRCKRLYADTLLCSIAGGTLAPGCLYAEVMIPGEGDGGYVYRRKFQIAIDGRPVVLTDGLTDKVPEDTMLAYVMNGMAQEGANVESAPLREVEVPDNMMDIEKARAHGLKIKGATDYNSVCYEECQNTRNEHKEVVYVTEPVNDIAIYTWCPHSSNNFYLKWNDMRMEDGEDYDGYTVSYDIRGRDYWERLLRMDLKPGTVYVSRVKRKHTINMEFPIIGNTETFTETVTRKRMGCEDGEPVVIEESTDYDGCLEMTDKRLGYAYNALKGNIDKVTGMDVYTKLAKVYAYANFTDMAAVKARIESSPVRYLRDVVIPTFDASQWTIFNVSGTLAIFPNEFPLITSVTGLKANYDLVIADVSFPNATSMANAFNGDSMLYILNVKFSPNCTDTSYMFAYCHNLEVLNDLDSMTGNVTNMKSMFFECRKLTEISIETCGCKNADYMFAETGNLSYGTINGLDFSAVVSMEYCFYQSKVGIIPDMDTQHCKSFRNCFYNCGQLNSVEIDFNQGVNLSGCFGCCYELTTLNLKGYGYQRYGVTNEYSTTVGTTVSCLNIDLHVCNKLRHDGLVSSFITNSKDRAAAGWESLTIMLHETAKALLSDAEKAAIVAKGYVLS